VNANRVWADIDLSAMTHNLDVIRGLAGPDQHVILVVKADAYGHGAVGIGRHAVPERVGALGVGTSAEALELRAAGISIPILILGTIVDGEAHDVLEHDVDVGLHSMDRCRRLQELAARLGRRARVHLNVDTGMGRLGVLPERALDLLAAIHASPHLELAGIMTHASSSNGLRDEATVLQLARFDRVVAAARRRGLARGWVHAANSACVFTAAEREHSVGAAPWYDAIRPGISAYGMLPRHLPDAERLHPVLSLSSRVVFLKDLPRGAPVGYDSTWIAPRPSRIATLPLGYDDGMPWRLGNRGHVLIRGHRARIVGHVSMDYTTVDVTDIPGVEVEDVVTIIGRDGRETITLEDVARTSGTISYEVVCALGKRVPRLVRPGPRALSSAASTEA